AVAQESGKPLVALSNLSDPAHPALMEAARRCGVPYLRCTKEGLLAVGRYIEWARGSLATPNTTANTTIELARRRLEPFLNGQTPAEHEARNILESYGVQGPDEQFVADIREAARAAEEVGFPVVLKGVVPGMIHKS